MDSGDEQVLELLRENVRASWAGALAGWIGALTACTALLVALVALLG